MLLREMAWAPALFMIIGRIILDGWEQFIVQKLKWKIKK